MTEMTLQELCKQIGVTRRAVQGYEKAKLVSSTNKTESGYLLYNNFSIERIRLIKLYQEMGFSIKEIQEIIDAPADILKSALLRREEKLKESVRHNRSMIVIIHEMIQTL